MNSRIATLILLIIGVAVALAVLKTATPFIPPRLTLMSSSTFAPGSSEISAPPASSAPWFLPLPSATLPLILPPGAPPPPTVATSEISYGFGRTELSPYFHRVRLGSVAPGSGFGSYGYISLIPYLSGTTERILVSDWLLQANRGGLFVPRAVSVYDPSGLSDEGVVSLKSGEFFSIYTGVSSPIGKNMRLNKCIGYLENTNRFIPPLPRSCPLPARTELRGFSGQCVDYVYSLGSCGTSAPNPPIPQYDYACRDYLSKLNYRGCFDGHRADLDFLGNEWRAWTQSQFLDPRHDRVLLLDSQGLLVDVYEY